MIIFDEKVKMQCNTHGGVAIDFDGFSIWGTWGGKWAITKSGAGSLLNDDTFSFKHQEVPVPKEWTLPMTDQQVEELKLMNKHNPKSMAIFDDVGDAYIRYKRVTSETYSRRDEELAEFLFTEFSFKGALSHTWKTLPEKDKQHWYNKTKAMFHYMDTHHVEYHDEYCMIYNGLECSCFLKGKK